MSVSATLSSPTPAPLHVGKGTAGLETRVGGAPATVSALRRASKEQGNQGLVRNDIG